MSELNCVSQRVSVTILNSRRIHCYWYVYVSVTMLNSLGIYCYRYIYAYSYL